MPSKEAMRVGQGATNDLPRLKTEKRLAHDYYSVLSRLSITRNEAFGSPGLGRIDDQYFLFSFFGKETLARADGVLASTTCLVMTSAHPLAWEL